MQDLVDGQRVTHRTNKGVLIVLQCVRLGQSYRVSTCYGSTGAEVDGLCASYPTEAEARNAARHLSAHFNHSTIAETLAWHQELVTDRNAS